MPPLDPKVCEVLDLPSDASAEQAHEALTAQRRTWQKRQASPDAAKSRIAEDRTRLLDEVTRLLPQPDTRIARGHATTPRVSDVTSHGVGIIEAARMASSATECSCRAALG